MSKNISLSRLKVGGALILAISKTNHHNVIVGLKVRLPLFINSAREWVFSYCMLVSENKPELVRPWASIIIIVPTCLQCELDDRLAIIIAMWATDEYAIRALRSGC